jgi:antitoxin component YwqK of YwqJK toxin-antitoxin module
MFPNLTFRRHYLLLFICSFLFLKGWSQTEFGTKHDSINWVDAKGMKQGKFRKTDKSGKKVYEGMFRNNKPVGTFHYFDEDGAVTAISVFAKDGKSCNTKMFHRNGNVWAKGKYIDEKRDSVWTIYSSDTLLVSRESYLAGKKNGKSITYFPNGGVAEESTWKAGVEEGLWKTYSMEGAVKGEGTYVNNCLEGIVKYYCPDGQIRIQCVYHDCLPHGQWLFYKCGSLKIDHIVVYKNGNLIGKPGVDVDKLIKEGLEEFKEKNELEHGGGEPGKDGGNGGN